MESLEKQLLKRFPDGDKVGEYLRSASFNFNHFKDAQNLNVVYKVTKEQAKEFKSSISKNFMIFYGGKKC